MVCRTSRCIGAAGRRRVVSPLKRGNESSCVAIDIGIEGVGVEERFQHLFVGVFRAPADQNRGAIAERLPSTFREL